MSKFLAVILSIIVVGRYMESVGLEPMELLN